MSNPVYVQTTTGSKVNLLNPKIEDFDINTVAHSLSMKCRFNGLCNYFYSVAQHAVYVSELVNPENALWGLLHELDEVFLPDIPTPVKRLCGEEFHEIAELHMTVGASAFGLTLPIPYEVIKIDRVMAQTEKSQIMVDKSQWEGYPQPLNVTIQQWAPDYAMYKFLKRYYQLRVAL